jgi:hypothetical protein
MISQVDFNLFYTMPLATFILLMLSFALMCPHISFYSDIGIAGKRAKLDDLLMLMQTDEYT